MVLTQGTHKRLRHLEIAGLIALPLLSAVFVFEAMSLEARQPLKVVAPVSTQQQLEILQTGRNPAPADAECAKLFKSVSATTKDAAAQYRLGSCYYSQVVEATKVAGAANQELREFVIKCNATVSCGSEKNRPEISSFEERNNLLAKDLTQKRTQAMDALARSAALGGKGPESAASRSDLERLFKTIQPSASSIDALIAQKKKELGL